MLHYTPSALLALLLLASCGKQEFGGPAAGTGGGTEQGDPEEIRFEIAVATATAAPGDASTRVATNTDFTSAFTAGDRVGLYIVKGEGSLQSSGNWVDNALMTFDGRTWTCDLPAGRERFPKDGSKLSFYAYYPYDARLANPLAMSFTVQSDQSTTGFSSSYLMTASNTGVSRSHNPVPLSFSHRLAMVKVSLKNGTEAKDQAPCPADVVTLKGRQFTAALNLATAAVGTSGPATDIKMHYNPSDECWYALVPAQEVTAGRELLTFQWTDLTTLSHKPSVGFNLSVGEIKQLDVTINAKIDPNYAYKVGDVYPHRGFPTGFVIEVSNGGKNGKIVSMWDKKGLIWGPAIWMTLEGDNGRDNMNMLYVENGNSFDGYPAFQYCHELNPAGTTYTSDATGIWYLPSIEELKKLRALYNEGMGNFIDGNAGYWSSESDGDMAKAFYVGWLDYGFLSFQDKSNPDICVRAVMAF